MVMEATDLGENSIFTQKPPVNYPFPRALNQANHLSEPSCTTGARNSYGDNLQQLLVSLLHVFLNTPPLPIPTHLQHLLPSVVILDCHSVSY